MREPMNEPSDLEAAAKAVVARLKDAGFETYWAGGCVRDLLSGKAPKDYDVATAATPEEVERLFRRAAAVGKAFGVVRVPCRGHWFEVATFRKDGAYLDGRRPSAVEFSSAAEDAARRDFTINGMFLDPQTGEVADFVGGKADLAAKIVRAIGDPDARFGEDSLRLLRAVRFASPEGFALEPRTAEAISRRRGDLRGTAPERVREELAKIAAHGPAFRGKAATLLLSTGLFEGIFGGLGAFDSVRVHEVPARTKNSGLPLYLAGLLGGGIDAVSPKPAAVRFAEAIAERLRLSNDERATLETLLGDRGRLRGFLRTGAARRRLFATRSDLALHLDLAAAEGVDDATLEAIRADAAASGPRPAPLLDGGTAIRLGAAKGPALGFLLRRVRVGQLAGRLRSSEEALDYVRTRLGDRAAP
jgi:tRNA nucleotidyltransferase/poly(A) polymerase